jgi:hypothetical protein
MTKYFCDICKREASDMRSIYLAGDKDVEIPHACASCREAIERFIRQMQKNAKA